MLLLSVKYDSSKPPPNHWSAGTELIVSDLLIFNIQSSEVNNTDYGLNCEKYLEGSKEVKTLHVGYIIHFSSTEVLGDKPRSTLMKRGGLG